MKISMIAPELRKATRLMSMPLPIRSALGRGIVRRLMGLVPDVKQDDVVIEVPGGDAPDLRIYRPRHVASAAALFWIHGGGFVIGNVRQSDRFCIEVARDLGITVVATGYRLAPEHPFPAPLDDCHAGWQWLLRSAETLGIDPHRIAIGGQSAGGGLAASLIQRIQDGDGIKPGAQWLFCPMLDDRTGARRELDAVGHRLWNNRLNAFGWGAYLGTAPGSAELPPYAVAARRKDLRGLPPAWIGVGDVDLFCGEDRAYATRLQQAGVETSLDIVAGAPHGFEAWAADTDLARGFIGRAKTWLSEMLIEGEAD
jgi:acetyl esterase/lipase